MTGAAALADRIAIVTGSSTGLGHAIAAELAARGYVATALPEKTMAAGGFDRFAVSDDASYVTGSSLTVDGGWLADGGWGRR